MRSILILVMVMFLAACDGPTVRAVYAQDGLWVWESGRGADRLTAEADFERLRLSPDGRYIVTLAEGRLILIDTYGPERRTLLTAADIDRLNDGFGSNTLWYWWLDEQTVMFREVDTIRPDQKHSGLWTLDVQTRAINEVYATQDGVASLRISPDAAYAAVRTESGLDVLPLAEGDSYEDIFTLTSGFQQISVHWLPDSDGLLTVGPQVYRGAYLARQMTVTRLDLDGTQTELTTIISRPAQVSISPDGAYAASIGDKWLRITRLADGVEVQRYRTDLNARLEPRWSPDSTRVLFFDIDHQPVVGTLTGEAFRLTPDHLAGRTQVMRWLSADQVYLLNNGPDPADPTHPRPFTWHYMVEVGGRSQVIVSGRPAGVNVVAMGAAE